jgi:hypothetical protein
MVEQRPAVFIGPGLYRRGDWTWPDLAPVVARALVLAGYPQDQALRVMHRIIRARDADAARAVATEWADVYVGTGVTDPDALPLAERERRDRAAS